MTSNTDGEERDVTTSRFFSSSAITKRQRLLYLSMAVSFISSSNALQVCSLLAYIMSRQRKSRRIALPKYRAVGHPPPDVEKLICKTCWSSPFWWNSAWSAISASNYSRSSSFLFLTPTWAKMEHSIKSMQCGWCGLVSKTITEDPVRKAPPQDGSRFHIRVQFSQHLEVEDDSRTKRPADRKTSSHLNVESKQRQKRR